MLIIRQSASLSAKTLLLRKHFFQSHKIACYDELSRGTLQSKRPLPAVETVHFTKRGRTSACLLK